jgi:3-phenylpropionate/trans-cinnamate dioxygenase ferredoxin reductase subunit
MTGGTLIVGASQAGVQLAASLRELGYDEAITLVGAEKHYPYSRPPLSKAFLAGKADLASLELRTPAFYADRRIDVLPSETVVELDLDDRGPEGSGTAVTASGRRLAFDKLALTVGARPRRLVLPGIDLEGVCYLRVVEDAVRLKEALVQAQSVVVIGGGFVGLEAAAVARSEGKDVTVIEAAERLVPRSVAPVISEFLFNAHSGRGARILLGSQAVAMHGENGRVTAVELGDGSRLPADLVVVGVGIVARTELAEQIGLECDRGIVVDEFARTSIPSVVAAGDCTVLPNPLTGEGRYQLESTQNADNQARTAAATLAGKPQPYDAVPWFWSDQYDLKLQIAGLTDGYDQHVVRGDPSGEKFSVLYYRHGQLLAIDAINHAPDYMTVRAALARRATIPADRAADPTVRLKDLIVDDALARVVQS